VLDDDLGAQAILRSLLLHDLESLGDQRLERGAKAGGERDLLLDAPGDDETPDGVSM